MHSLLKLIPKVQAEGGGNRATTIALINIVDMVSFQKLANSLFNLENTNFTNSFFKLLLNLAVEKQADDPHHLWHLKGELD